MSLVDYAASDEDEELGEEGAAETAEARPTDHPTTQPIASTSSTVVAAQAAPTVRLPNPAELLGGGSKKRPAAAAASNGSYDQPHRKVSHGKLPPSRLPPDTANGQLVPPQLVLGRRNVVTEDLEKLFVRKRGSREAPETREP